MVHGTGLPSGEDDDEMGIVRQQGESLAAAAPPQPDNAAIIEWLLHCHRSQLPTVSTQPAISDSSGRDYPRRTRMGRQAPERGALTVTR